MPIPGTFIVVVDLDTFPHLLNIGEIQEARDSYFGPEEEVRPEFAPAFLKWCDDTLEDDYIVDCQWISKGEKHWGLMFMFYDEDDAMLFRLQFNCTTAFEVQDN